MRPQLRVRVRSAAHRGGMRRFEFLEERVLLAGPAEHVFAQFDGMLDAPDEQQQIDISVSESDFTLDGGQVRLGFQLKAADGSRLDPAPVAIDDARGNRVRPASTSADLFGNTQSLVLADLQQGQYTVTVSGERGTTGAFQLDVLLVGDANGDRHVNQTDTALVDLARQGIRIGETVQFGLRGDVPVVGDWDGNGVDELGVVRGNVWFLDTDGEGGIGEREVVYGLPGDRPVVGDVNGDGIDELGVVRGNVWFFDTGHDGGIGELVVPFGLATDRPVLGDIDGDGVDDLGMVRDNVWWFDTDRDGGNADVRMAYGLPGDEPVMGDWNADGTDEMAVVRNRRWYVDVDGHGGIGEQVIPFGLVRTQPVPGEFSGSGATELGLFRDGFWIKSRTNHYRFEADANLDGRITAFDAIQRRRNRNDAVRLDPLALGAPVPPGLTPLPNGTFATDRDHLTLSGTTNPGANVTVTLNSDVPAERHIVADGQGSYSVEIPLPLGPHQVATQIADGFGQRRVSSFDVFREPGHNIMVTTDQGVQQMPSVAVNPTDPNHVVIAYMDYSLVDTGYAGIGVSVSHDGGITWQQSSIPVPEPFNEGAANPIAKFDDQGRVFVSFMAATFLGEKPPLTNPTFGLRNAGMQANNGVFVARSHDGLSWDSPVAVVSHLYSGEDVPFEVIPDLAIDTFARLPNGDANPNYGNLYVSWTRLYPPGQFPGEPDATGGGDVMIAVSRDGGQRWETQLQQRDGLAVSVIQLADNKGSLPPGIAFVDQSHVTVGPQGDIYVSLFAAGDFAVHHSTDGAASFLAPTHEEDRRVAFGLGFRSGVSADGLPTNHFRTHAVRAIVADPARPGHAYAAEPIDNSDALGNPVDAADVHFARSADFGETWTRTFALGPNDTAKVLNDDNNGQLASGMSVDEVIAGQALARIAVDMQGNVGAIWYDTRRDPANHVLDVFGTLSSDGGQSFGPNFRLTDVSFDADAGSFTDALGEENFYLGDFIGLAMANNTGFAAWTDTRNGSQDIVFARYRVQPPPAAPNDRFEPNQTPATATPLGRVVQRVEPKLAAAPGDEDWFRVEAAATGELIASVAPTGDGMSPSDALRLELWDANATALLDQGRDVRFPADAGQDFLVRVIQADASAGGTDTVFYSLQLQSLTGDLGTRAFAAVSGTLSPGGGALYQVASAAAGSIEVQLTGGDNVQGDLNLQILDAGSFAVLASGKAPPGPSIIAPSVEPNDAITEANSTGLLGAGAVTIDGFIGDGDFGGTSGDFDYYSLEVGANHTIAIDVDAEALGSELDSLVILYDSEGNFLAFSDDAGDTTDSSLTFTTAKADTYFVAVMDSFSAAVDPFATGAGTGAGTTGTYSLTITTEALGPGAIERASLPIQKAQTSLLLVTGENGSSGDFTLAFSNLDQFTTAENQTLLFPAGVGPSSVAIGDLNEDGSPDLVASTTLSDTISVLLGNGDGTFQSARQFAIGAFLETGAVQRLPTFGRFLAIDDFDGDHMLDVVVTNSGSSDVSLLLGRGDGTFEPQRRFDANSEPLQFDVGDFNNDSFLDPVVVDSTTAGGVTVGILLGRGDGTFQPQRTFQIVAPGGGPDAVRVGDMNEDGKADLVINSLNTAKVHVLLGNGDGTFVTPGQVFDDNINSALAVADLDADGTLDVISGDFNEGTVSLLLGNGDGTLQARQEFFAGQTPIGLAVADAGSQVTTPDGSTVLGPPDGRADVLVAASGVQTAIRRVGPPQIVVLPAVFDETGEFVELGAPVELAAAEAPTDLDTGDLNNDGAMDVAVADRDGVLVIFGQPPVIAPNDTLATARDLGSVVHFVDQTQTIVPEREDAFFKLTVPTEALSGAGDEVIDFSALFEHEEGAGLAMEVLDPNGNVLDSGERFRLSAAQGDELTVHIFGLEDGSGGRGAGAFTLLIDVLPQVVSVESQPLLPGAGDQPGGPTASIVFTFRGDRLDPATAEDPANYTVIFLGDDDQPGGGDDQVIPITCGAAESRCIVYNPGANVEVTSGKMFPTAVRQTVTLLFDEALPAGSYQIELSSHVQTFPFNENELDLLTGDASFSGHPVVSLHDGQILEGSQFEVTDLVLEASTLGDFHEWEAGTPFLTQLHNDLAALLDAMLTERGDDPAITGELIDQVLSRFDPALGEPATRTRPVVVIWIDPVSIDLADPNDDHIVYDLEDDSLVREIQEAFVQILNNMEVIVAADSGTETGSSSLVASNTVTASIGGAYALNVANVPERARGAVICLGVDENTIVPLTDDLRAGVTSFTFTC